MQINVAVQDANNIVCEVVPPQVQTITIDRGVEGNGIVSIVPVTISTFQYLRITYTNGTVVDVGPLTSTAYTATSPITIVGNTISLGTVPVANGGTGLTSFTSGGIVYASSAGVLASGSALNFNGTSVTASQFLDTGFALVDNTDNTKKAVFELAGLTTGTTYTYTLPALTSSLASLGNLSQTFLGATTFAPTTVASALTIGSTNGTGAIILGRSTVNQTLNIGTGATTAVSTKAINIGTAGVSGSTTNITIGSAVSGAVNSIVLNTLPTLPTGTINGVGYINASNVFTTGIALAFDGTNLKNQQNTASPIGIKLDNDSASTSAGTRLTFQYNSGDTGYIGNQFDGTDFNNQYATNRFHIWLNNGSEQMRLTSIGLGIGTSSISEKFTVVGNIRLNGNRAVIFQQDSGVAAGTLSFRNSAGAQKAAIGSYYNVADEGALEFIGPTNSTNMLLNSSGNLGLGVTPNAWGTNRKALQIGGLPSAAIGLNGTNGAGEIYYNSFFNTSGGATYAATSFAGKTDFNVTSAGGYTWNIAASGTAGNAITFTQAMTLDASGNLLVGTTATNASLVQGVTAVINSGGSKIHVGHVTGTINGESYAVFSYNATAIGTITQNGTTAVSYNTSSDYRLKNITGPITTSGAYIDSLNPVEGTWKADGSTFVGLIAHEAQEASRTTVATGVKDGEQMQGMDYSSSEIIANLIAEIQDLRKRLAAAGI